MKLVEPSVVREEWRPVLGFEDYYEVSNRGGVRSLERVIPAPYGSTRKIPGRVMKPTKDHDGYLWVIFSVNGERKRKSVHSLVLEAFIGERPPGHDIAHADANPSNNALENLRYATRSENMMDMVINGDHHKMQRTECPYGHSLRTPNLSRAKSEAGHRCCLSCERARGFLQRKKPYPIEVFTGLADAYYVKIMDGVEA